jgi:PhnB protein
MAKIIGYLTFNGNCREAMTFYKESLGGELSLQSLEQSPMASVLPTSMKHTILHCTLTRGDMVLMASDMVDETGLNRGNTVSLMLNCASEDEIRMCYNALLTGGKATHPLQDTFSGSVFGDLTDRYGVHWLFNYSRG